MQVKAKLPRISNFILVCSNFIKIVKIETHNWKSRTIYVLKMIGIQNMGEIKKI